MGIPVLKLNLVPEPSLWRQHHKAIGWAALGFGLAVLAGVSSVTLWRYHQARRAGAEAVTYTAEAKRANDQERALTAQLSQIDVDLELPRWRLAERILQERATPWSRLTAELEQSLVDGVRVRGLQRSRSNDNQVLLKLKAEAKNQDREAAFLESLRGNPIFSQVNLDRESQNPAGGWDCELTLPVVALLPPFEARPLQHGSANPATLPAPAAPRAGPTQATPKPVAQAAPPPPTLHHAAGPRREALGQRMAPPAVRPAPQGPANRPDAPRVAR